MWGNSQITVITLSAWRHRESHPSNKNGWRWKPKSKFCGFHTHRLSNPFPMSSGCLCDHEHLLGRDRSLRTNCFSPVGGGICSLEDIHSNNSRIDHSYVPQSCVMLSCTFLCTRANKQTLPRHPTCPWKSESCLVLWPHPITLSLVFIYPLWYVLQTKKQQHVFVKVFRKSRSIFIAQL